MGNTFYFDNDCGLCRRFAALLAKLTFYLDIRPLERQSPHVVAVISHKEYVANDAIAVALRRHGRWPWVRLVGLVFHGSMQRWLYYQVAARRSPQCQIG